MNKEALIKEIGQMRTSEQVIEMLERLIMDMNNNVTGDEPDAYMDGVRDCVKDVDRYIKGIRRELT